LPLPRPEAEVRPYGSSGQGHRVLQTDDFCDFWFERLAPGTYTLSVAKKGYLTRRINDIRADKDINVRDIELYKKS
jgi:hypothetical protein